MLILSRRCGQSIMIGDDVEVFVVDIGEGKVRLGITGPAAVPIHQRERYHPHLLQTQADISLSHSEAEVSNKVCAV